MKRALQNTEEYVSGFFLVVTVSVVIVNVLLRKLFGYSLFWAEEVSTNCFIWSVFVGASAAYKENLHIGIDLLSRLLPESLRPLVGLLINGTMLVLTLYLAWLSVAFIEASSSKTTPVLEISYAWIAAALLIGFLLMAFSACQFIYRDFRNLTAETGAVT
ncbi:TRAP transporter small permease [Gammaproteobacteria bacterium]|nr:TRAP transporter small permease [Gammaproteobacteria bacterium]